MKTIFLALIVVCSDWITCRAHPIHVSITNIDYMKDSARIDFSIQVFYDDFQLLINQKYNTLLDFGTSNRMTTKEQKSVIDYVVQNFVIFWGKDQPLVPKFTGWKVEDMSVWLYFTAIPGVKPASFVIKNTIMLELFADQVNLVILQANNVQKGFEFNKRITVQSINL